MTGKQDRELGMAQRVGIVYKKKLLKNIDSCAEGTFLVQDSQSRHPFLGSVVFQQRRAFSASLALSSVSSSSCWAFLNLARLRAAISSASSICFL